jgi:potassium-transporting ATPase KdpC subunit
MRREIIRAFVFAAVTMLLFGGVYHGALWGIGRIAFRDQADGSLIRRADGTVVGSRLIAQRFTRPGYVQPRPSAVDYDASSTGGSNLGTSSPDQARLLRERLAAVCAREGVTAAQVPVELITASGSGLDPDLSLEAVALQERRVARARGVGVDRVHAIVTAQTEAPLWGVFGPARVNVLLLNLALDRAFGPARDAAPPETASTSPRP